MASDKKVRLSHIAGFLLAGRYILLYFVAGRKHVHVDHDVFHKKQFALLDVIFHSIRVSDRKLRLERVDYNSEQREILDPLAILISDSVFSIQRVPKTSSGTDGAEVSSLRRGRYLSAALLRHTLLRCGKRKVGEGTGHALLAVHKKTSCVIGTRSQ